MPLSRIFYSAFFVLALCGCSNTQKAHYQTPMAVPRDAHTPPLAFSGLKMRLPKSEDIGAAGHDDYACLFRAPVGPEFLNGETEKAELQNIFENALEPLGYDVVRSPSDFFFEEEAEDEILRTEYKIGAKLVEVEVEACGQDSHFAIFGYTRGGVRGQMYAVYEWSIFDNIRKTTVYKTTTSGYTNRKTPNRAGISLMIYDTFEMAAHNLGSDHVFHDLMVRGIRPEITWDGQGKHYEDKPRLFNPDESVILPVLKQSGSLNLAQAKAQTVLVQGGTGHGSGFFIDRQGHIITNAHVVGNARRVRIVTSAQEEKLAAEILRVDRVRDVALLRLEDIPKELNILPLPTRFDWPQVGENIYVIGAPLSTRLQDTVTKGIISAHRPAFKIFGQSIDMLQADVAIQAGNSGGPLLDANGNIVGVAVAGTGMTNEALNFFVPIEQAFTALSIFYGRY